jgi:excisionase family DNA binding protein
MQQSDNLKALEAASYPRLDYLKTAEAANYLRLSQPTLERLRLSGDGPPFAKLGKAVRYRRADLDSWLASHLVQSTSEAAA